jgi:hypothetical protein
VRLNAHHWVALAFVLTFAVHGQVLGFARVLDDAVLLGPGSRLGDPSQWLAALGHDLFWLAGGEVRPSPYWRPTTTGSHILGQLLGGGEAWAHHLVSLLALGGLAGLVVHELEGTWARIGALALLVAHPMQVEVVAHAAARTDLLAVLFGLLALRCVGWRAGLLTLLAMGAKEVAVVVPVLAYLHARASGDGPRAWVPHLGAVVGFLACRAALLSSWALPAGEGSFQGLDGLLQAPGRIGVYLGRIVWPMDPVPVRLFPHVAPAMGLALAVVLLIAVAWTVRAWRQGHTGPGLCLAWVLLPLVPVSGLVGQEIRYAEGFVCWSLVGLALWGHRHIHTLAVISLPLWLWVTQATLPAWASAEALWAHARATLPTDPAIALGYGRERMATDPQEAERALRQATIGGMGARADREAHEALAQVLVDMDRGADAVPHLWEAAWPGDPDGRWACGALCVLQSAAAPQSALGALDQACGWALAGGSVDPDLLNAGGIVSMRRGHKELGISRLRAAVAHGGREAVYQMNLDKALGIKPRQPQGPGATQP